MPARLPDNYIPPGGRFPFLHHDFGDDNDYLVQVFPITDYELKRTVKSFQERYQGPIQWYVERMDEIFNL